MGQISCSTERICSCSCNTLHRPCNHFFNPSVCWLADQLWNDYFCIFFYQFSPNFACGSEMQSVHRLQILDFRGVWIPILAVLRLWSTCLSMYRHQIPYRVKIKQPRLAVSGRRKLKQKSQFRDMQIPVSVSISVLSNNIVCYSLPIFTHFCAWHENVVSSTLIVCETNPKQISNFTGVQVPILAFLGCGHHVLQQVIIQQNAYDLLSVFNRNDNSVLNRF